MTSSSIISPSFSSGQTKLPHAVTAALVVATLASAAYWVQLSRGSSHSVDGSSAKSLAALSSPPPVVGNPVDVARLLGAEANSSARVVNPLSRFVVMGVIAAGATGQGAALIAVDGQPAKPFAVGSTLAPGFVIKQVGVREVMLSEDLQGASRFTLSLPLPGDAPGNASANNSGNASLGPAAAAVLPAAPSASVLGAAPPRLVPPVPVAPSGADDNPPSSNPTPNGPPPPTSQPTRRGEQRG